MTTEQGRKCCNYCFDSHDERMDLPYCRNPQCPKCHTKPSMEERECTLLENMLDAQAQGHNKGCTQPDTVFPFQRNFEKEFRDISVATQITRANNELAEMIAEKIEKEVTQSSFYNKAAVIEAAAIARSFIRNEEEI